MLLVSLPLFAGEQRSHLAVIAVSVRGEIQMAMPVHGCHHRTRCDAARYSVLSCGCTVDPLGGSQGPGRDKRRYECVPQAY
jgi:hypothetical protein